LVRRVWWSGFDTRGEYVVKPHWKRWLTVGVVLGSAQLAVQLGAVAPAHAFYPPPVRYAVTSGTDSSSSKTVDAFCPAGLHVYGGGGEIDDGGARQVMLTELRPAFGSTDYFEAAAVEPAAGFDGDWSLTAYAICGNGINMLIVSTSYATQSAQYEITQTACGYARHAVGSGAAVIGASGRVGLQLLRPAGSQLTGWASARADSAIDLPPWSVTAYLVCAVNYPIGDHYVGQVANTYAASVGCPTGQYAFGTGAGGDTHDSGASYLQSIVPTPNLDGVTATMTSTPLDGGMVAVASCGSP